MAKLLTADLNRNLRKGFRGFGSLVRPTTWAEEHFRLASEVASAEGRFRATPYQRGLLDMVSGDGPERVVLMKGARIGYSTTLLAAICFWFGQRRRHVACYQMDDRAAAKFAKATVMPSLRECDQTRDLLEEGAKADMTLSQSRIGGKILRVIGGVSPSRFREYTSDSVLLDETDSLKADIGGEGSPVELASRAIRNSPFQRLVVGGTPNDAETSILYKEFGEAQLRFYFHLPCPHCGAEHPLLWENMHWPGKEEGLNLARTADAAAHVCPSCGALWQHTHLRKQLEGGIWRVPDTTQVLRCQRDLAPEPEEFAGHELACTDAGPRLRSPDGADVDWPRSVALHISSLYSPWWPWSKVVAEWLSAGDVTKRKAFVNLTLGEPWEDTETTLSPADMKAMRQPMERVPECVRRIVASVDVQQGWLSMLVTGWAADEHAYLIERVEFPGDTTIEGQGAWLDLENWLSSQPSWECDDDTRQPLDAVVVDSGFQASVVYREKARLKKAVGNRVFVQLVKGIATRNAPLVQRKQSPAKTPGASVVLYLVNNFGGGRLLIGRLKTCERVHFSDALPDVVFDELCSTSIVAMKQRTGAKRLELVNRGPQEAWDCLLYSLCALRTLQVNWNKKRRLRPGAAKEARDAEFESDEQAPNPPKPKNNNATAAARRRLHQRPRRRGRW